MLCAPVRVGRAAVLVDWRIGVLEDDHYPIAGILRGYGQHLRSITCGETALSLNDFLRDFVDEVGQIFVG